jgi:pimeloyl-ACP methyl ester carboxylesterase
MILISPMAEPLLPNAAHRQSISSIEWPAMRRLSPLPLILVAALAATPATAAAAKVRKGPAGSAFYTPPKKTSAKQHGAPIWALKLTGRGALTPAASNTLVLYRSTSSNGKPIAVSGTVTVPKGTAPKGGWPVLTWAHGTTGIADTCAPSRSSADALTAYVYPELAKWLAAGYAVVRTDYQGLGTPGVHGYLIGKDEGRSTLDIVRAARKVVGHLSNRVIIGGHSQGGHAALWAAALAQGWTPELKVLGTTAFAPASHLGEQASLIRAVTTPSGLSGIAALIFRAADTAKPSLKLSSLLSPAAKALYPQTLSKCLLALDASNSFGGLAPSTLLVDNANTKPLEALLNANDPEELKIRTPVLILQGTADTTVLPPFTDQLDTALRANGANVTYKKYEGVNHGGVVGAADADALAFAQAQLGR